MSYHLTILSASSSPLFTHAFGTSKHGNPGTPAFPTPLIPHLPFIAHSSLDLLDELQWSTAATYLKQIDRFRNVWVFGFVTGTGTRFILLYVPEATVAGSAIGRGGMGGAGGLTVGGMPVQQQLPPQTEDAVRNFFAEVFETWVKTVMNPFYRVDMPVTSPVFRGRVSAAAKKYL